MSKREQENPKLTDRQADEWLDQVDRTVNQPTLPCGHKPCTLGHCKGCENHCQKPKGKKK